MPRQPKPYLRKQTKSWYCSIAGRQIPLGRDRRAAYEKFHELMANRDQVRSEAATIYELSQAYLDWCEEHRKPGTYSLHRDHLKSFIGFIGKRLRPSQLRVHHVVKWCEQLGVSSTTQNGAVTVVQRMLNWSVEQEYLLRNPIKGMRKPRARRRDVFYSPQQWEQIKEAASRPVVDLLDFLYLTGCRPLEARTLDARHLHGDLAIFPADESKGERDSRVIYLVEAAREIVDRLRAKHPAGVLFRNSRGKSWTKNALVLRLTKISEKVGFRVIAYGIRHSFATNALTEGGVDPISVAHLMGHRDPTMVSRVYSHIARNPNYLREQAAKAICKRTAS